MLILHKYTVGAGEEGFASSKFGINRTVRRQIPKRWWTDLFSNSPLIFIVLKGSYMQSKSRKG